MYGVSHNLLKCEFGVFHPKWPCEVLTAVLSFGGVHLNFKVPTCHINCWNILLLTLQFTWKWLDNFDFLAQINHWLTPFIWELLLSTSHLQWLQLVCECQSQFIILVFHPHQIFWRLRVVCQNFKDLRLVKLCIFKHQIHFSIDITCINLV